MQDFVGVTSASAETAGKLLDSFDGNLERAVAAYFDGDGGAEGAPPAGGAADADEPMPDNDWTADAAETDGAPTSAALQLSAVTRRATCVPSVSDPTLTRPAL